MFGVGVETSPYTREGKAQPNPHLGASIPGGKVSPKSYEKNESNLEGCLARGSQEASAAGG